MFRYLVLLALFIFAAGCAVNPVTGRPELCLISESMEKRLGKRFFVRVDKESFQGPILTEGFPASYLQSILNRFMPFYERRGRVPVIVGISPVGVPNAWSIPGYVVINLGIVPCISNEAQLAFIMGHELGHIAARHTAQRYTKAVLLSLGVKGVSLYAGDLGELVANVAASLYIAKYSRDQERMADSLGFKYMSMAGYDPYQTAQAMRCIKKCGEKYMKLLGIKKASGFAGFLERIFADHPGTEERVKILAEKARLLGRRGIKNTKEFPKLKKWAVQRFDVVSEVEVAGRMMSKGFKTKAFDKVNRALKKAERMSLEPDIAARIYTYAGFVYLMGKKYRLAREEAMKALRFKRDYYIPYKVAGIAGLRDGSEEGLKDAEEVFSSCIEEMANDQDLISAFGRVVWDPVCLKGALISSCRLGDMGKCKAYCRTFERRFGLSPDIVKYCF